VSFSTALFSAHPLSPIAGFVHPRKNSFDRKEYFHEYRKKTAYGENRRAGEGEP
jgi:hypothetical protein